MPSIMKNCLPLSLLTILLVSTSAQSSCTKKMLKDPTSASDQCLSDQVKQIDLKIAARYADIISELPEVATPASETENETLSKARMQEVYTSWKSYQQKACSADASRQGLLRNYENRMVSICWITAAKQHLAFLR
jgi:hypothetical protein